MAEVKVLVEGVHKFLNPSKLQIHCTTTLIKGEENIIVDPGSFVSQEKLLKALEDENLKLEDIQNVILTHSHVDHTTNISLFKEAKIFLRFRGETKYVGMFQKINEGVLERFDILNEQIVKDVKIIETPGHTNDSISIVVDSDIGKVVIAGDAINSEDWLDLSKKGNPDLFYDVDKFDISRDKILEIADWVVPGHGKMFKIEK
jgi:glyoxylase-like metal-dependent hydrolase (beta-lactamase superfamily II)